MSQNHGILFSVYHILIMSNECSWKKDTRQFCMCLTYSWIIRDVNDSSRAGSWDLFHYSRGSLIMLCTAQLGGPVLKAFGRVQFSPFQLADKSPLITGQHTAGGPVSQLSQLAKLSPWLTLSTKDITTSFWHYNEWFWFLYNQIMG